MESISSKTQYWFVVLYFWPMILVSLYLYVNIRQARMIRHYFRHWALHRFWEIVSVAICVWSIKNVVEIKTSLHWTIASGKCFFECYIVATYAAILSSISRDVIRQEEPVLRHILVSLYDAVLIAAFKHPKFSAVIMAYVVYWLSVLALEIVVDECCSIWHRNDKKPLYTVTNRWKLAAVVRSSNNGYGVRQFVDITMCDVDEDDDIFSILVLEVRRRNRIWRSLILWRVSLLDGTQKKIHEFQLVTPKTIGRPFARLGNDIVVHNFLSRDLVIIVHKWPLPQIVFLYDLRSGKTASYKPRDCGINYFGVVLDFACLQRNYNTDGSIRGWRVRIVDYRRERCECHPAWLGRSVLRVSTIDFGTNATLVSQEEIVFGQCSNPSPPKQFFRSTRNLVGVRENLFDDGPIIMFDRLACKFARFPDFDALKKIDRPLALYFYTPTPRNPWMTMGQTQFVFPTYLTKKGCVDVYDNGLIVRTNFEPPSMFRGALEAMFQHAGPALRMGMDADEFRRLTGIEGMGSRF